MAQRETTFGQTVQPFAIPNLIISAIIVIGLAVLTHQIVQWSPRALEFPIWAAALGLGANLLISALGFKERLGGAFRTEFFLKTGLVLLGASVNITQVLSIGLGGLLQAVIMITAVFFFTWWLSGVFHLDHKLRALIAAAVSVCGVSAAIATTGAVLAKKEQLAYVTTLVIAVSLPLMVVTPYIAQALNLPPQWAGAWFGGNIDTTAAVVGAGTLYGEEAVEVASIVKLSQNALIGVVVFLLSLYWVLKEERPESERPSVRVLWDRFPKFVLGFILVSVVASLGFLNKDNVSDINALRHWALTLAFVSIGWDISFGEFRTMGTRPVIVYVIATLFNTVLALGVSWAIFAAWT